MKQVLGNNLFADFARAALQHSKGRFREAFSEPKCSGTLEGHRCPLEGAIKLNLNELEVDHLCVYIFDTVHTT